MTNSYISSHLDEAYRVRLLMLPGVNGSDYINASFVDVSIQLVDYSGV